MASRNTLLQLKNILSACEILAVGYVKNTEGRSGNLYLYLHCRVYPETGATEVYYSINCFNSDQLNHVSASFGKYDDAVAKYNQLLIQYNGYAEQPTS